MALAAGETWSTKSRVNGSIGWVSMHHVQCCMPLFGYYFWMDIKLGTNSCKGSKIQISIPQPYQPCCKHLSLAVCLLQPSLSWWSKLFILVHSAKKDMVMECLFALKSLSL
jgi:hypothetical protein